MNSDIAAASRLVQLHSSKSERKKRAVPNGSFRKTIFSTSLTLLIRYIFNQTLVQNTREQNDVTTICRRMVTSVRRKRVIVSGFRVRRCEKYVQVVMLYDYLYRLLLNLHPAVVNAIKHFLKLYSHISFLMSSFLIILITRERTVVFYERNKIS